MHTMLGRRLELEQCQHSDGLIGLIRLWSPSFRQVAPRIVKWSFSFSSPIYGLDWHSFGEDAGVRRRRFVLSEGLVGICATLTSLRCRKLV